MHELAVGKYEIRYKVKWINGTSIVKTKVFTAINSSQAVTFFKNCPLAFGCDVTILSVRQITFSPERS